MNNNGIEQCDDGNTTAGDGCDANCQTEFCGDGFVNNNGTEQCDDGNTTAGDGCDAACQAEYCGDGIVNNGEECDDGNQVAGDGCSASCMTEYLYWTNFSPGKVVTGTRAGEDVVDLVPSGVTNASGIAIDQQDGLIFFTDGSANKILRSDLDGSNVVELLALSAAPFSIDLDPVRQKMWWVESAPGVWSANADGSQPTLVVDTWPYYALSLAIDSQNGKIYWTDLRASADGHVHRADLDGSNIEDFFIVPYYETGIALDVDHGFFYVVQSKDGTLGQYEIVKCTLDGSSRGTIVSGLHSANDIAVDPSAGMIYWTDLRSGTISRAGLDGSSPTTILTIPGGSPRGIALP